MVDLEDIDVVLVELAHHLVERTRPVLQRDPEPREAARAGKVAQQDIGEQARVDIPAAQHEADIAALELLGMGQHRSEPGSTGAFDHGLLHF